MRMHCKIGGAEYNPGHVIRKSLSANMRIAKIGCLEGLIGSVECEPRSRLRGAHNARQPEPPPTEFEKTWHKQIHLNERARHDSYCGLHRRHKWNPLTRQQSEALPHLTRSSNPLRTVTDRSG